MITTKVLLHKSALKVEVHLLMYQSGAEYLMEVVYVEDKNIHNNHPLIRTYYELLIEYIILSQHVLINREYLSK